MNQGQVPEGPGTPGMPVEHLQAQPLQIFAQSDQRRIPGSGAIGLDAQVRRLVAHERHQNQHRYPAHQADDHEHALPTDGVDEVADDRGQDCRADAAGGPEDADSQPQAAAEPIACRCHQRHHGQRLGHGHQDPEEQEEVPDLSHLAQEDHADQEHDAGSQQHLARTVTVAQPPGDGSVDSAEKKVGGDAGADGEFPPPEIAFRVAQRRNHDPGCHGNRDGENLDGGQNSYDDPAIVKGQASQKHIYRRLEE